MNSWRRGDPVCMASTTESPPQSHTAFSFFFFLALLLWETSLHRHEGQHNNAVPCDESTVLNALVILVGPEKQKKNKNV